MYKHVYTYMYVHTCLFSANRSFVEIRMPMWCSLG